MDVGEFQGRMAAFADNTERRLGAIEEKCETHGLALAKIEQRLSNGNGKPPAPPPPVAPPVEAPARKPWPTPVTLSLGAGGAAALGAALLKVAELVIKHFS